MDEPLDASCLFRFGPGLVDAIEHLHQAPRVPQLRVLGDEADEVHVLDVCEVVASLSLR